MNIPATASVTSKCVRDTISLTSLAVQHGMNLGCLKKIPGSATPDAPGVLLWCEEPRPQATGPRVTRRCCKTHDWCDAHHRLIRTAEGTRSSAARQCGPPEACGNGSVVSGAAARHAWPLPTGIRGGCSRNNSHRPVSYASMLAQLDRLKTALADRYAIEEEIGSGGMATVYLAERSQTPPQPRRSPSRVLPPLVGPPISLVVTESEP